jgi:hypothetical protein
VRRDLPDVVVGRQQGAGQRRAEHRRALDADPGGGDDPGGPTPELAVADRVVGKDNRRIAVRMSGDPAGRHDERIVSNPIEPYAFSFFSGRRPECHQTRLPADAAEPEGGGT